MIIFFCIGLIILLCIVFGGFTYFVKAFPYLLKPTFYKHAFIDIYNYFKYRKWRIFNGSGIIMYGGLFGTGKTLQMVHYAESIYKHYDNIEIYSNVTLNNIPYTPFLYLEQLLDPVEDGHARIYICDEFGSLFNSRNYKDNTITEQKYLAVLNQIRKEHKTLVISTQRYGMVDKVFRQVCKEWRECHKVWRFYYYQSFDPYELEFTLDPNLVRPTTLFPVCTFATNKVYGAYNTFERVLGFMEQNVTLQTSDVDTVNRTYADNHVKKRYRSQR